MAKRTTKRKRRLIIAIVSGSAFILVLLSIIIFRTSDKNTYVPGEDIEGLTRDLARDLPEGYPQITFTDVSQEAGIVFNHFQAERTVQLPEDMGSGAAWGDFNNDGCQDVFIANFSGPMQDAANDTSASTAKSHLYRNNGDGTFSEISEIAGIKLIDWANACAWGDYDNDGNLDLFVTIFGKNRLYRNLGNQTFQDVSAKAGIDRYEQYWAGTAWGDYNRDGHLDLYVCGYVDYKQTGIQSTTLQYNAEVPTSINPSSFEPIKNLLLRNNGNGTFSDVAEKAGVSNENGKSLEVVWSDFDHDGWPDLYVANDVSDNALFRNKGDGTFEDVSYTSFVADYRGAMGIGVGDWDNDEDLDMMVTHWMAQENALYTNLMSQLNTEGIAPSNRIKFMDEADRYGLGQIALDYIGFGTFFFDYNNDSRLDLFVVNGSTFQQRDNPKELIGMQDQLFWNRGKEEGFFDVSKVSGAYFNETHVGRGAAYADYDNDGDLDVLVVNNIGPAKLLRNDGGNDHNWLQLQLVQKDRNRFAVGAKVRLVTGTVTQIRQVGSQGSYFSQNSLVQHFGLNDSDVIDTLEITWTNGKKHMISGIRANQLLTITEEN